MVSLDTNTIIRLVLNDIPDQANKILELLRLSGPKDIEVADLVFAEVVWILSGPRYKYSRQQISDAVFTLLQLQQLNCNRQLFEQVLPLYAAHPKLSFVDVCLATYAELNNAIPLLTFDKPLAKALPNVQEL